MLNDYDIACIDEDPRRFRDKKQKGAGRNTGVERCNRDRVDGLEARGGEGVDRGRGRGNLRAIDMDCVA